jgi:hypothetical protein
MLVVSRRPIEFGSNVSCGPMPRIKLRREEGNLVAPRILGFSEDYISTTITPKNTRVRLFEAAMAPNMQQSPISRHGEDSGKRPFLTATDADDLESQPSRAAGSPNAMASDPEYVSKICFAIFCTLTTVLAIVTWGLTIYWEGDISSIGRNFLFRWSISWICIMAAYGLRSWWQPIADVPIGVFMPFLFIGGIMVSSLIGDGRLTGLH